MAFIQAERLEDKINSMVDLVRQSSRQAMADNIGGRTGFVPVNRDNLIKIASSLARLDVPNPLSLDFGCGVGNWALVAAAMGIPSYGVDTNGDLIKAARKSHRAAIFRGIVGENTTCKFAEGNMYAPDMVEEYVKYAGEYLAESGDFSQSLPVRSRKNPYAGLGINVQDATIIYAYLWRQQMPFFSTFLKKKANPAALIIFPAYSNSAKALELERVPGDISGYIFRQRLSS